MAKFMLLSIVIASVVIPARAAAIENPRVGLKKALVNMAIFDLVYLFALIFVYLRIL